MTRNSVTYSLVRVVISDLLVDRPTGFGYATQDAEVIDRRDYYPFGMEMPGRRWRVTGEGAGRFGYNGKENDNEVKGEGNQQDYGFRIYDPRVARFLSVDPLTGDYPSWSPYPFAMNRVIDGVDLDGKEWSSVKTVGENDEVLSIVYTVKIKVVNSSYLTKQQADLAIREMAKGIEEKYSGETDKGVKVRTRVELESVDQLITGDYGIQIVNEIPTEPLLMK